MAEYGGQPFNATQQALSVFMRQSWATFIATGSPNERGSPEWPHYSPGGSYVILSIEELTPPLQGKNFGNGNCAFWLENPCQPDLPSNTCQFNETFVPTSGGGDGDGLSDGAIAGIVIGSTIGAFILLLSLVVIVVLIFLKRRGTQSRGPYKLMKEEDLPG